MIDPRTPVIAAVGQHSWRDGPTEPIEAMAATVAAAFGTDPSILGLARKVGAVRVVGGIWPYRDPGRLLADVLALPRASTGLTAIGGNETYDLVTATALDIQTGGLDVALIASAETMRTRRRARKDGGRSSYRSEEADAAPDRRYGSADGLVDDDQIAAGVADPVAFYAMAEVALRHARGERPADHRRRIADLWASGSEVAADNRHAWLRRRFTGTEVERPSEGNRMVAYPYTKLMTSNVDVDQSAAVLLCSYEAAREAGVDPGALVFPLAGSGAADHRATQQRWALHESPAMRAAGTRALELAGWAVDDIDDLDLYSCFPAAVQVAQAELDIPPGRPFTITGGLTFAGGPFNSYCMHALATAVERIRDDRSTSALLSGNGGYFTKHSFLALADRPGDTFRSDRPQADVDAGPIRPRPRTPIEKGTVEAYTVTYDRSGAPVTAIVSALDADGARHWLTTSEPSTIGTLIEDDAVGRTLSARPGDSGVAQLAELR